MNEYGPNPELIRKLLSILRDPSYTQAFGRLATSEKCVCAEGAMMVAYGWKMTVEHFELVGGIAFEGSDNWGDPEDFTGTAPYHLHVKFFGDADWWRRDVLVAMNDDFQWPLPLIADAIELVYAGTLGELAFQQ